MQNFSLLKRAGRAKKPVLLKRGMSATLEELLMAAEYIMSEGNYNVILCERGVRTFADHTRNTLDLSIVPAVQRLSHLPIIVDPSHGTGKRNKVTPLSRAAIAVGANGLDGGSSLQSGPGALRRHAVALSRSVRPVDARDSPDRRRAWPRSSRSAGRNDPRRDSRNGFGNGESTLRPTARLTAALSILCMLFSVACKRHAQPPPPGYHEYAYVSNGKGDSVSVIDLLQFRNVKTIPVGKNPTGLAVNPRRNEIYVVNTESNNVSIIDAETNQVVSVIGVHHHPYFIDVSADGKRAYVANSGSANVSIIDLDARRVIATIPVGGAPGLAKVAPDGKTVVASNRADNSVSIIDAQQNKIRSTVPICTNPEDIVILPDSARPLSPVPVPLRWRRSILVTTRCSPSLIWARHRFTSP